MGGKRHKLKYGTRFDERIRSGVLAERGCSEIARAIGVSPWFVQARAHAMGLSEQVKANIATIRRRNAKNAWSVVRARKSWISTFAKGPGDRTVSDVARSLRDRPAELSDAAIAALHERGLTLDELREGTGRHPFAIIRAVREAARC